LQGATQDRRVAKALNMGGFDGHGRGPAALAEEGVATEDSVTPDCRDVLLTLPTSCDRLRVKAAMCVCGVKIGKDGCGHAVAGVDMQSVGGIGRLCDSNSFGGRSVGGGGDGGGTNIGSFGEGAPAAPDGIPAAQAIIPAEPFPIHCVGATALISW